MEIVTGEMPVPRDVNRDLTERLKAAGKTRGFEVMTEYPIPGGRIDVVWASTIQPPFPGIDRAVPIVAFEIESSWRTRKHVKGDLLNLLDCGASIGVIVLADSEDRDDSLLRFARALTDRPGPHVQIWTQSDVLALDEGTPASGSHSDEAADATVAAPAGQVSSSGVVGFLLRR